MSERIGSRLACLSALSHLFGIRERRAARELAAQRLQRLVAAIESGVSAVSLSAAIVEREADIRRLDIELAEFVEPLHQRLAVIPSWVENQLRDLAGLLNDTPERTKIFSARAFAASGAEPAFSR